MPDHFYLPAKIESYGFSITLSFFQSTNPVPPKSFVVNCFPTGGTFTTFKYKRLDTHDDKITGWLFIGDDPNKSMLYVRNEYAMNEYRITTKSGTILQWFADTASQAKREAVKAGHKGITKVQFVKRCIDE
jgi:hypothetical protein